MTVVVAVIVAIGCELIVIIYTVFDSIRTVMKTRKEKKKVEFEKKLSKMITEAQQNIGEEPIMKKVTTRSILNFENSALKEKRLSSGT